jgi:hypothetical protein
MTLPRTLLILWAICAVAILAGASPGQQKPAPAKYGPDFTRLHDAREHIQRRPAPDFWALIPYYVPQPDDHSCSNATAAMVVNALRAGRVLTRDDKLATPQELVEKLDRKLWKDKVSPRGKGLTLDEMGRLLPLALKAHDVPAANAEVIRFPEPPAEALAKLRRLLADNERSADDLILVNFLQSGLTGDPDGAVGHFAPVAAYDGVKRRVLILDPDRRWYEPYWVPDEKLLAAMNTRDADAGRTRGLVRVRVRR